MTGRERLMATLRGEAVDRPAVNFYEIGGFRVDPSDPDEFNVYNDPSWRPLLKLAEEKTDLIRMRSPVSPRSHEVDSSGAGSSAPGPWSEFFTTETYTQGRSRLRSTTLKIGGRTMRSLTRRDPDIDTVWTLEHLLKGTEDLKAYLELPDEVFAERVDTGPLLEEEQRLGDSGIVMVDTEDPVCRAASLFSMEDFTVIALQEQRLFHRLLEKVSRHLYHRTEETAKAFRGRLWRIYGPEYVTEPYLPPRLFKEYVVRYTGPMVRTIHEHGGFARIHCHGRLGAVLEHIVEMGADAIDPIEPPPYGDVELARVRREYGRQLVLFGNIEVNDVENMELPEFEKVVRKALEDGTWGEGRGFVLMPSSAPNGRKITSRMMANYETMVRLAGQFGP
ncbi:MAG: hypothetical protein JSU94_21455 [Phycisphaerales bacterium]|nr:MAG: hypothetical protein JSU94_21455 [Phycisphaerales bacterium]